MRLIIFISLFPFISFSQTLKYRQYKPGETYKYKLTTEVYRNDKFSSKDIAVSEHKTVNNSGILSEEIRWLSKTSFTSTDSTISDSIAKRISPYIISLSPDAKVLLPKLTIPEMVGSITDLNTFFVAIAPALNMHKLSPQKKSFTNDKPVKGNFADSIKILYGTDYLEVTQYLLSTTKNYSIVRTDFLPPASFYLEPLLDTIGKKTFAHLNNFQMIQKAEGGKVNLLWGVESFVIITKLDNKSGKIIEATMTNNLNLRMRYNSSPDLSSYVTEIPVAIKRNLKLELLKE